MNLAELHNAISSFLEHSTSNRISESGGIKIYDAPLLGVASGDDPLFLSLKECEAAGEFYATVNMVIVAGRKC